MSACPSASALQIPPYGLPLDFEFAEGGANAQAILVNVQAALVAVEADLAALAVEVNARLVAHVVGRGRIRGGRGRRRGRRFGRARWWCNRSRIGCCGACRRTCGQGGLVGARRRGGDQHARGLDLRRGRRLHRPRTAEPIRRRSRPQSRRRRPIPGPCWIGASEVPSLCARAALDRGVQPCIAGPDSRPLFRPEHTFPPSLFPRGPALD